MLFDNGIPLGYHSDGGDITVISPWLNFYTMITGKNLKGDVVNAGQTLTRAETLWLATAANKWFIWEDDLGSIEVGNHADLAVLDRDYFTVPDEDIKRVAVGADHRRRQDRHRRGACCELRARRLRASYDAMIRLQRRGLPTCRPFRSSTPKCTTFDAGDVHMAGRSVLAIVAAA